MVEPAHILDICPAVVKRFFVDVVPYKLRRCVGNNPVHTNKVNPAAFNHLSAGVVATVRFFCVPVEPYQVIEPIRVNKGKKAVLQWYLCCWCIRVVWVGFYEH